MKKLLCILLGLSSAGIMAQEQFIPSSHHYAASAYMAMYAALFTSHYSFIYSKNNPLTGSTKKDLGILAQFAARTVIPCILTDYTVRNLLHYCYGTAWHETATFTRFTTSIFALSVFLNQIAMDFAYTRGENHQKQQYAKNTEIDKKETSRIL